MGIEVVSRGLSGVIQKGFVFDIKGFHEIGRQHVAEPVDRKALLFVGFGLGQNLPGCRRQSGVGEECRDYIGGDW